MKYILFILFFWFVTTAAQTNFTTGFLPKIVVSLKTSDKTKWVNSIESRNRIYDDFYQFSHSLVDVSSIFSVKTDLNQSFNLGYIIRFRNAEIIHRTFQHYNIIHALTSSKLAQRFAFEQFYQTNKKTTYRTRYRFSFEKPLNGDRLDINEFYVKLGNEYLYNFTNLEVRFTPYLGYQISKKDKIEFGFDYRLNNFIAKQANNNLWFRATWYVSL